jgi:hypothetical protein
MGNTESQGGKRSLPPSVFKISRASANQNQNCT